MSWSPDQIKALRLRLGMTMTELATKLNVSYRTVLEWEQGKRPPSTYYAARLTLLAAGVS